MKPINKNFYLIILSAILLSFIIIFAYIKIWKAPQDKITFVTVTPDGKFTENVIVGDEAMPIVLRSEIPGAEPIIEPFIEQLLDEKGYRLIKSEINN